MRVLGPAWRWIREQLAFLMVLLVLLAAFGYLVIDSGRWSRSTGVVAVSLLLAGALRCVCSDARVGMLAVRGRIADTICYLALGGLLLGLDIRLHG